MHPLLNEIKLTEASLKKFGYFFKIEELQLLVLLSIIDKIKPKLFFDIGSNVGFYSLFVGRYTNVEQILSFEPTPETFKELKLNSAMNDFPIVAKNIALSNSVHTLSYADFGQMSGRNGIVDTSIHNTSGAIISDVDADYIDNIFFEKDEVITLKIDTEGHEASVIEGGKKTLLDNRCVLQVEVGHGGRSGSVINDLLGSLGYELILSIGPDSYYSNIDILKDYSNRFSILESALNVIVECRWK